MRILKNLLFYWSRFWAGSLGSVLTVIGTVAVGLLATVFFQNIHDSWPITAWNGVSEDDKELIERVSGMHQNAKLFWATTTAFLAILFFREFHRLRADARTRAELESRLDHLRQIVLVMPPKDFLSLATDRLKANSKETELALLIPGHAEERDILNNTIRNILESIINLAIQFDPPTHERDPSYKARIFWYIDINDLPVEEDELTPYWEGAKKLSHLSAATAFFKSIDGLLVSDQNLTVDIETSGPSKNSEFICIGFTDPTGNHTDINQPGVAQCLSQNRFHLETDSSKIHKGLSQYGQSAKEKIEEYYQRRQDLRSLLSIPVEGFDFFSENPFAEDGSIASSTVAVISISSNEDGMLGNEEKTSMYYLEMAPFLNLLYRLCARRAILDAYEGRPFVYNVNKDHPASNEADS